MEDLLQKIESLKEEFAKIKQSIGLPIGVVEAFATPTPPAGWIACNGQELRIDDYQELYNAIGDAFNGENTAEGFFCVPNLQGQFIRGWDEDGNTDPERQFGSQQEDALQGHGHSVDINKITMSSSGQHNHTTYALREASDYETFTGSTRSMVTYLRSPQSNSDTGSTSTDGNHTHSIDIKGNVIGNTINSSNGSVRKANETRPKNIALLFCIKAQ